MRALSSRRLPATAYWMDGALYFPVVDVVRALGGEASWNAVATVVGTLNGVYFEGEGRPYYMDGDQVVRYDDPKGQLHGVSYPTCMRQDFFELAFGLVFDLSQDGSWCEVSLPCAEPAAQA